MFATTGPAAIEGMRQAADELRGELVGDTVTFVVNRNTTIAASCLRLRMGARRRGTGDGRVDDDLPLAERLLERRERLGVVAKRHAERDDRGRGRR